MISYLWLIPAFLTGAVTGAILLALVVIGMVEHPLDRRLERAK